MVDIERIKLPGRKFMFSDFSGDLSKERSESEPQKALLKKLRRD